MGNYFQGPAEKMKPQKTDKRQHCPAPCSKTQLEISIGVQAMELCNFVQMNQIKNNYEKEFIYIIVILLVC